MKLKDILLTANANLGKSKLRTFLTVSAVFIGALTLMLTTGVGAGLKVYVEEQVNAVGAEDALIIMASTDDVGGVSNDEAVEYEQSNRGASGDIASLPRLSEDDLQSIREKDEVIDVNPLYSMSVEYITTGQKQYVANFSQSLEGLTVPQRAGRAVEAHSSDYEITLAPALVQPLGFESDEDAVNQTVTLAFKDVQGETFTLEATVVGVQEKTLIQGNAMLASISLARAAHERATAGLPEFQRSQYTAAVAQFDDTISDEQLQQLKQELADDDFSSQTLDDQLGVITNVIDGITTFLNIFAGIALVAATFGIVNTLLMAVQERTREIGLMKALGMGRRKIFALFSFEAILIGLWGAVLALLAANLIGRVASSIASTTFLSEFEGLQLFSFPAGSVIPVILLIMGIAFLAGSLPARRASRLDPIEALRYE